MVIISGVPIFRIFTVVYHVVELFILWRQNNLLHCLLNDVSVTVAFLRIFKTTVTVFFRDKFFSDSHYCTGMYYFHFSFTKQSIHPSCKASLCYEPLYPGK